jgi:hypothetical protein
MERLGIGRGAKTLQHIKSSCQRVALKLVSEPREMRVHVRLKYLHFCARAAKVFPSKYKGEGIVVLVLE